MVRLIPKSKVLDEITFPEVIDAVEEGFLNKPESNVPDRTLFEPYDGDEFVVMPGEVKSPRTLGLKLGTIFQDNDEVGVPRTLATMLLFEPETGMLSAIVDGTHISHYRTGAIGAVGARYLSTDTVESIGVIGSSTQARYQIRALDTELSVETFSVYSRSDMKHDAVEELDTLIEADITAGETVAGVCEGAGVVVVATDATDPVFEADSIDDGTLVIGVGAVSPDEREIPGDTMARADDVYVDNRAGCRQAGDVCDAIAENKLTDDGLIPMSELVSGSPSPTETGVTVLKSVGTVVLDLTVTETLVDQVDESSLPSVNLSGFE